MIDIVFRVLILVIGVTFLFKLKDKGIIIPSLVLTFLLFLASFFDPIIGFELITASFFGFMIVFKIMNILVNTNPRINNPIIYFIIFLFSGFIVFTVLMMLIGVLLHLIYV
jgi:hypothetical protein